MGMYHSYSLSGRLPWWVYNSYSLSLEGYPGGYTPLLFPLWEATLVGIYLFSFLWEATLVGIYHSQDPRRLSWWYIPLSGP